jgi:protein SCO1/2
MKNRSKYLVVGLLAALVLSCESNESAAEARVLPILGQSDVDYKMVDGVEVADTLFHTVADFKYLNQDSVMITSESMKGKVWISDFFFTHCPTICPPMTSQLKRLNGLLDDLSDDIQFMSFSIDPKRDTPSRLSTYIEEHEITASNWQFFTGNEAATHLLGVESFLVHAGEDDTEPGGFAHGDIFTLVDREGRVRGIYHGTDAEDVTRMEEDVRKLLKHEYGVEGSK